MGDNKRKRGRKPKPPSPPTTTTVDHHPRSRGRPKKVAENSPEQNGHFIDESPEMVAEDTPELVAEELMHVGSSSRRRGRPKTTHQVAGISPQENGHFIIESPEAEVPAEDHHPPRRGRSKNPTISPEENGHFIVESPKMAAEVVFKVTPSMDAVVKVFCVHTEPNFSLPWQRKRQYSSSSSGFVIGGRRVLTNAHSVEHFTQVKVKKRGSDTKYLATVLAIGTECDIAMLTVDDDEFWEGVSPVAFGDLPALQDAVTVVGYPIGGDTISVTSGVVSRIEILSYVHGSTELLGLQIDAAINSGNSGGPAFNGNGKCVGIAFQSLKHDDVENIGYVIPTPVISHFIQDFEKNVAYTGFPVLGIEWQKMENPDLRVSMGMAPNQKGVRIRRIEPTSPESRVLKSNDVILSFDGVDIANDGTVPFRHGERMGFSYLVSQKFSGDSAMIKVLRNSKTISFNIKLDTHKRLIPAHIKGRPPSYYIVGGFVFSAITVPYLRSEYGKDYEFDAPVKLLEKHLHGMAQSIDEQLVVVSQVLVADINIGYEEIVNTQVIAFNGKPLKNLKSLASMVESCDEEFLKFDLEYEQKEHNATSEVDGASEITTGLVLSHPVEGLHYSSEVCRKILDVQSAMVKGQNEEIGSLKI